MKIASLGKKKNNDTDTLDESYPLPDLPDKITPAGGSAVQASKVAVVPVAAPVAEAAPPTKTAKQEPPKPNPAPPTPAVSGRSSVAEFSIASLMNSANEDTDTKEKPEEEVKEQIKTSFDPHSEQKIEERRRAVIEAILAERPRFVVAFEKMTVAGHTITVEVPSQTLYEEIMRSKTEILLTIARTAGVDGTLDLEVKVNEQIRAARPIKLEDRIKHMTEKNPMVLELKKALDMEYE